MAIAHPLHLTRILLLLKIFIVSHCVPNTTMRVHQWFIRFRDDLNAPVTKEWLLKIWLWTLWDFSIILVNVPGNSISLILFFSKPWITALLVLNKLVDQINYIHKKENYQGKLIDINSSSNLGKEREYLYWETVSTFVTSLHLRRVSNTASN